MLFRRSLLCILPLMLPHFVSAQPSLDETPAAPGDWGYRPGNSETTAVNPPAFSWRPTDGIATYTVQIATDEAFENPLREQNGIVWNTWCPDASFPAGSHYWRYRGVTESGEETAWSEVRSFTIPADAPAFPQPTLSELRRRMPKEHPRLFYRPEDIGHLKELAAGPLSERWQALVEHADKLLESPPDTTEPPKYPEGTVRLSEEWKAIWWGNRRRAIAVADSAATLGFVYRISGNEKYAKAARDLLVALTTWDPEGSTQYKYNDEAAMPLLYMTSRAYDWAYPALSEEDRNAVIEMMWIRGEQCFNHLVGRQHLWHPYASHSNRAWHFLGELAIAFHGDFPDADRWLDFAMTVFYTAYPVWSDSDGGWHEGIAYWSSYMSRFMYWAHTVRAAFGIDVFERPFFQRVGDYGMYLLPPGMKTGGFSDQSTGVTSSSIGPLMAVFAAGARNPYWKWYADEVDADIGGGYVGFLAAAHAQNLEAKAPTDRPESTCFYGTGLAALNSNLLDGTANHQIQFKSSPMGRQSHGYNANNAFLLNLNGERVFLRTGKRDVYGSPHHKDWMWHSRSDNAILVNGAGQVKHSPNATGRITAFATSDTVDVVAGEAGASYENLDRWSRRIVFLKPNLIVIHDWLEAPEPSTFQWTLHAPGAFELGENTATWSGDPGHVRVRFLEPAGLALSQTDQFDPPPAEWANFKLNEWHLTADCAEKAKTREFVTVIEILDAPEQAPTDVSLEQTPDGARVVTVTTGASPTRVLFARDAFEVDAPEFAHHFEDE
ncbi:MAG: heparinase [Candidatus Hydrogenedentota bacterium]